MRASQSPPTLLLLAALVAAPSCTDGDGGGVLGFRPNPEPVIALGDPLPDLTPEELAAFERGKAIFMKDFEPSEGLGPFYNATACRSCHSTPAPGGAAPSYRNFYLYAIGGRNEQRGAPELPSIVIPAFGTGNHATASFRLNGPRYRIPDLPDLDPNDPGAQTLAQRASIPIFGVGLFELISDATIFANADPEDLDGDGISGRFNRDSTGVGRFGVKAQSNNLELFTRGPLQNQMGITSNPLPGGSAVGMGHMALLQVGGDPNDPTLDSDGIPDPEISEEELADLIAFSRFLAPPPQTPFDDAALRGQAVFEEVGCAKCHIPSLESSRGPVEAYTDLLLHEMGNELRDEIVMGRPQASPSKPASTFREFRTAPLWGVSHSAPYLHDGRAETIDEAIRIHSGEARGTIIRYEALTDDERADLIRFLEHL